MFNTKELKLLLSAIEVTEENARKIYFSMPMNQIQINAHLNHENELSDLREKVKNLLGYYK